MGWLAMGYKFSLVLSREITGEEASLLHETGCECAVLATDTLPTNAEITVTRMDFDDTVSPSLAEAIESALEAVTKVPDLSVPGLTVPAQPAQAAPAEVTAEVVAASAEEQPNGKKPGARKATARKGRNKKADQEADVPVVANGHGPLDPDDLVQAAP
jgi:hypothetical protein